APPAPVKEDARSEHILSYINKPDVGTASEQACSEFKQDWPLHMNFQAWVPQDQGFNPINGLRLGAAPQGSGAPPPSGYSLAYGSPSFGIGNISNLDGALSFRPPPGPLGSGPSNWLPGSPPFGSGAPGGFFLGRLPDSGPSSGWRLAISTFSPQGGASNHYYYYYNAGAPAQKSNDQGDSGGMHEALAREEWLDI
ncbi:hypothetical protein C0995_007693, partial [Termitomyces sp. Mi166